MSRCLLREDSLTPYGTSHLPKWNAGHLTSVIRSIKWLFRDIVIYFTTPESSDFQRGHSKTPHSSCENRGLSIRARNARSRDTNQLHARDTGLCKQSSRNHHCSNGINLQSQQKRIIMIDYMEQTQDLLPA